MPKKSKIEFAAIPEPPQSPSATAATVVAGKPVLPHVHVLSYSEDDWELFIYEWVHFQKTAYTKVERYSGAGDMGIDVAGQVDDKGVNGVWDNFQCKHYDDALTPGVALPEIAKVLWYTFKKEYVAPRKYYFIAPKNCGTALAKLLKDPKKLRQELYNRWDKNCANEITSKETIALDGDFKNHVDKFDLSIFSSRTCLEILDEHRKTPYYAIRFGGGLPDRPKPAPPPSAPAVSESRYVEQSLVAYGDHKKEDIKSSTALSTWPELQEHFGRQREFFYYAEALRNFARDTVPSGTFEDLQNEVHAGVVDLSQSAHDDGFACVNAVTQAATALQLTSNPLISVIKTQDRRGICHQLANDDRLKWKKK